MIVIRVDDAVINEVYSDQSFEKVVLVYTDSDNEDDEGICTIETSNLAAIPAKLKKQINAYLKQFEHDENSEFEQLA